MPYLACWRAAKILHALLLDNVLKTPLQFFEVTPVGRILSRFSKDIDVLDTSLPFECADMINCTFEVTSQMEKTLKNIILYFLPGFMLNYLIWFAFVVIMWRYYVTNITLIMIVWVTLISGPGFHLFLCRANRASIIFFIRYFLALFVDCV